MAEEHKLTRLRIVFKYSWPKTFLFNLAYTTDYMECAIEANYKYSRYCYCYCCKSRSDRSAYDATSRPWLHVK